jgi:pSer/pThr/pTyr-binding forkhead associated (FHA) protein
VYRKEKEIREYIEQIRGLCDKVIESLDRDEEYDIDDEMSEFVEDFKGFDKLGDIPIPYIVRKKTGEKVIINRDIFKIGKEASYVDYCINDNPTISRSHANIIKKPDGFYVKDLDSLNHTFLNGVKLEQNVLKKLENGCLIQLSDEVFEWHCD